MKALITKLCVLGLFVLALTACGGGGTDTTIEQTPDDTPDQTSVELSGQVQKGPFIVGTEITIQELNDDLTPTGRSFQTETTSNLGDYVLPITLASSLVEISANGYYFNEVTGALSNSTIRLSVLADTSDSTSININILTHLAKKRIRTLVTEGSSFSDAKVQAETEVRSLFSFDDINVTLTSFDEMDISQTGNSNAFLLLASSIFQEAYRLSSSLSEYIESLSQDLSDNGAIDNSALTDIIGATQAVINLDSIRGNLESKYTSLGQSVVIPNFESLINRPPHASIKQIQSIQVGVPLTLNGSFFDRDNDTLEYLWTLETVPEGSVALITNDDSSTPSFTPDVRGTYTFSLVVSDGEYSSDPVTASASTPLATSLAKISGDFQLTEQHELLPQEIQVQVQSASDSIVVGELVTFSAPSGSEYFSSVTVVTDSNGLASWTNSFQNPGEQKIDASVNGLSSVAFTIYVTSLVNHPYDGIYNCAIGSERNMPMIIVDGLLTNPYQIFGSGWVGHEGWRNSSSYNYVFGTIGEDTGQLDADYFTGATSMWYQHPLNGQCSIDESQRSSCTSNEANPNAFVCERDNSLSLEDYR